MINLVCCMPGLVNLHAFFEQKKERIPVGNPFSIDDPDFNLFPDM
jgi:hypothetical protein